MTENQQNLLADCPTHGRVHHFYSHGANAYLCRLGCGHFVPDERVYSPVERCQTCIHPEGYDRLSGPCPTCNGDGVIPPGGSSNE